MADGCWSDYGVLTFLQELAWTTSMEQCSAAAFIVIICRKDSNCCCSASTARAFDHCAACVPGCFRKEGGMLVHADLCSCCSGQLDPLAWVATLVLRTKCQITNWGTMTFVSHLARFSSPSLLCKRTHLNSTAIMHQQNPTCIHGSAVHHMFSSFSCQSCLTQTVFRRQRARCCACARSPSLSGRFNSTVFVCFPHHIRRLKKKSSRTPTWLNHNRIMASPAAPATLGRVPYMLNKDRELKGFHWNNRDHELPTSHSGFRV